MSDGAGDRTLLSGGGLTPIARVGETVLRPAGPWTPAVHALLRHLERRGFAGAPRVLGLEEVGGTRYERLTFVDGAAEVVPEDDGLVLIARLIRHFHAAAAD